MDAMDAMERLHLVNFLADWMLCTGRFRLRADAERAACEFVPADAAETDWTKWARRYAVAETANHKPASGAG
jgi:hypothetical protein